MDLACKHFLFNSEVFLSSKERFFAEAAWIEGEVRKTNCDVVLAHGDLWWGNIIYNEKNGNEVSNTVTVNLQLEALASIDFITWID